ncbi:TonB-dependent receptor [Pedobacter frigiditerrae]|uniref:SusC/RagA family TonB-linked outer membrane protein n=1 Tax=Pedobacter frigiditerrae TaxID=2530452 RepID=UPI002931B917|nr:TonB-dependent receptor [Pedobacter frigiditerrae]
MKQKLLKLFVLSLLAISTAFAQSKKITGKVLGAEDGLPIPGVSVKIKGTNTAVQTENNGTYSITVPSSETVLVYSYLSYVTIEKSVGNQTTINVSLETATNTLNQVVVVAYGTQKKSAITGSVATIGAADIEKRTVTNATQLLQGASPGVLTTSGNGQPGTNTTIRLRGFGSFAASSSPLVVLDGSQYDGSIGDINVNDIDNISILKDASSSALYGARAANGVIIITTKRGKSGSSSLNATINQGFSERGTPEYNRLDAYQYYPAYWQAIKNNLMFTASPAQTEAVASQNATNTVATNLVYNPFNVPNNQVVGLDGMLNPNASLLYDEFDWFKPMTRTGKRTDANMSFSGKTEKADYFVSLGYLKDNGYIIKSDFKRFNGRINVNGQIKPWLKTGLNLSASLTDLNNAFDSATGNASSFVNAFSFARGMGPIYPVHARSASGSTIFNPLTGEDWYDFGQHPGAVNRPTGASAGRHVIYETMLNDNLARRNNFGARTYVDVTFLKDFTFTPAINIDIRSNVTNQYQNPLVGDGASVNGLASYATNTVKSYTFNQILNYRKMLGSHNITATLGHENYDYTIRSFSGSKTSQTARGNTELANFVTISGLTGNRDLDRIESYFSRATYNYNEKYFLEGSVRRDGSSRFAAAKRWGTFFSAGASWSIIKEDFMKNLNWVSDLRLKASYGEVGNNALDTFYAYDAFYDLGFNNSSEPGVLLSSLAAPNLKWETSKTLNLGLSFGFLKNRILGELEYFKRGSGELLFSIPKPLSNAVTSELANIGSMENRGWELQLSGDILRTKNFNWNLLTNWTIFKNEITALPVETPTIISGTKRREVGQDIYAFWLRQYAGVDPNDGSALYIPADGTAASNIRTVNGVQYVTNQTFAKFAYSGTAIPDLSGSFTNTFTYKDLSLSFLINYQIGGKFYDSVYQGLMSLSYGSALHADAAGAWTTTNKTSQIPRLDYGNTTNINAASSRWLVDASYINFANVNLSYRLPKSLLSKIDVAGAKVFFTGENLGTISKRRGLDPRQSFDGVNGATYLSGRIYSFGLSLSL